MNTSPEIVRQSAVRVTSHDKVKPLSFRYESLDLWRGVACLFVLLCHAAHARPVVEDGGATGIADQVLLFLQYGSVGVPMFFVISGYCIAATAINAYDRKTPLKTYFYRRVRRIYPPYWAALLFLVGMYVVFDVFFSPKMLSAHGGLRPWWFSPSQWLGNLTLTETWRHHLWGSPLGHVLGPSWTLCFEEQFYFVVGMLLCFPRRLFFPLCLFVTVACVIVQQATHANGVDVTGFFFDGYWLAFAFGIGVFYATNYWKKRGQIWMCVALLGAACFVIALPGLEQARLGFSRGTSLALAALFALLLIVLRHRDSAIKQSRLLKPLFACGAMCYSLYLVHDVVVAVVSRLLIARGVSTPSGALLVTIPICVAASLIVSTAFYWFIERRFLNLPLRSKAKEPTESSSTAPAPKYVDWSLSDTRQTVPQTRLETS